MSFLGIEIARRSLHGHQLALATTAHNIANVNTPGYSRQEAVLKATLALSYPAVHSTKPGQIGTGMTVAEIIRHRDAYLDRQVREAKGAIGFASGFETAMRRVETIFPEPSDHGVHAFLSHFFNSWHSLAQDPTNPGSQQAVRGASGILASSLSLSYQSLSSIEGDMQGLFAEHLDRINTIGGQIAELNRQIAFQRTAGANPNDLLDRRDVLLEELATLADLSTRTTSTDLNLISVSVYGVEIVDGTAYLEGRSGFEPLAVEDAKTAVANSTRGMLAATAAAQESVESYRERLWILMESLAGAVNETLGTEFFAVDQEHGVLSLGEGVAQALTSMTSEQAWAVAQLREQKVVGDQEATLDTYYHRLMTSIGADLKAAQHGLENVNAILSQVDILRESVSGVNLDEELARMIQFQYGYQAAARVINVMDELLDTLINRMF